MVGYLDAHAKPPSGIREIYKHYQKIDEWTLDQDPTSIQFPQSRIEKDDRLAAVDILRIPTELREVFASFIGHGRTDGELHYTTAEVFEIVDVPGLFVYPSLLPQEVQVELLTKLLHRDLSHAQHQTNVHLHYHVPYPVSDASTPGSYFDMSSKPLAFSPKDPVIHKPFSTQQFLDKKLRWMTLGGQYDWTKKVYPSTSPPAFPDDVKRLVEDIFPMRAEAAIVNLYSPGDTLSLHRDVSEECNRPLASISFGCDALFIAGLEGNGADGRPRVATIRLRSGDALLMSGESRYAWHGVPKVLKGTCPEWMRSWPAEDHDETDRFANWRGWMAGKRVNLNVRQMFA